jgi:hypothetical protein
MPAKVILNPYSNRWKAKERWADAASALNAAGVEFEMSQTDGPGYATDLTASAVEAGFSPIIVAGGDGTIGEVLNGLARVKGDDPWGPLGILPLGTANDLSYTLNLPLVLMLIAPIVPVLNDPTAPLAVFREVVDGQFILFSIILIFLAQWAGTLPPYLQKRIHISLSGSRKSRWKICHLSLLILAIATALCPP